MKRNLLLLALAALFVALQVALAARGTYGDFIDEFIRPGLARATCAWVLRGSPSRCPSWLLAGSVRRFEGG